LSRCLIPWIYAGFTAKAKITIFQMISEQPFLYLQLAPRNPLGRHILPGLGDDIEPVANGSQVRRNPPRPAPTNGAEVLLEFMKKVATTPMERPQPATNFIAPG